MLIDSDHHKGLRKKLVAQIRSRGIENEDVLRAIDTIPRHLFVDSAFEKHAYDDKPIPIGNDQTISQPFTVAFQTSLLEVDEKDVILEIGTGSGYQAAILALLAAEVYTVERHETLCNKAAQLLKQLGMENVRLFHRDGYNGLPDYAPYDKIIVTAGAPNIPAALKEQLKTGGHLVIPVGRKNQKMMRLTRLDDTTFKEETFGDFRFVPLLKGKQKKSSR